MVRQLGPGAAEVTSQELGTNCWHPRRFVEAGSRCEYVYRCRYPEKRKCKAVLGEIDFLGQRIIDIQKDAIDRMQKLGQSMIELHKIVEK